MNRSISRQRSASSLSSRGADRDREPGTSGLLSPYNSRSPLAGLPHSPLALDAATTQFTRPKYLQDHGRRGTDDLNKLTGLVLNDVPTLGSPSSSLVSNLHSDSPYPSLSSGGSPKNPNLLSAPSSGGSRRRANTASGSLSPISPNLSPTEPQSSGRGLGLLSQGRPANHLPPIPTSNPGPSLPPPPSKSRTASPTPISPPRANARTANSTPSTTPTSNSNMYGQRQQTDPGRPFQVPPPPMSPPPALGNSINSIMTNIPPPPPRYASAPVGATQLPGPPNAPPPGALPPPPGPPPGSTTQWQGTWNSSYGSYIPPPPPPSQQAPRPYNTQQQFKLVNGQSIPIPPPPPPSEQMSATYIPQGGNTYGEGVGIPGLGMDDGSTWSASSDISYLHQYASTPNLGAINTGSDTANTTPSDQYGATAHHRGNSTTSNATSNGTPGALLELANQWPLEKVLSWLQTNNFSKDWISTFRVLDLHGAKFLELGSRAGGRGNFGMMHQQVYPRLAIECTQSGNRWDQTREREEGKRMRRLIRSVFTGDASGASYPGHARKESTSNTSLVPTSAGPDSGSPDTPIKIPGPGFSVGRRSLSYTRKQMVPFSKNNCTDLHACYFQTQEAITGKSCSTSTMIAPAASARSINNRLRQARRTTAKYRVANAATVPQAAPRTASSRPPHQTPLLRLLADLEVTGTETVPIQSRRTRQYMAPESPTARPRYCVTRGRWVT